MGVGAAGAGQPPFWDDPGYHPAAPAVNTRPADPARILIVDDDRGIRDLLASYLGRNGYHTTVAADGQAMWAALARTPLDLVVLDLTLPDEDGLALCEQLRARSQVPVIMVSARGRVADRVAGLQTGADDYLAKPFDPWELSARIQALLRRTAAAETSSPATTTEPTRLRFSGWQLDLRSRELEAADGRVLSLGGSDYRLLRALLAHPHRPLDREWLAERIYGRQYLPQERAVDVCVSRLRQLLEPNPRRPRLILTRRNEGYQLNADVDALP